MTLRITGLTKTFDNGVRALRGVSLSIGPGLFGLLGENGAGKSTFLRILATLIEPDAGTAELDGLDLIREPARARRVLGYLPQEFGVYARTSAEVMLDHFATLKGFSRKAERRQIVAELLHQVNLYDVRARHLDTFSGGMKRRFGIAQALIGGPRLLIVDEPTAGLDPSERNHFQNLLSEIGERTTIILATHIVEDVESLCHQVGVLAAGQVISVGGPAEVVAAYAGKVWQKRMARSEARALPPGLRVITTRAVRGEVVVRALGDGAPAPGFEERAPTLEDAYFAAIAESRSRAASGEARVPSHPS